MNDLTKRTIKLFDKFLYKGLIERLDEVSIFGTYLYKSIFTENIHEKFKKTYGMLNEYKRDHPDVILRIILEFHTAAKDLAGYPWEYIYFPDNEHEGRGFFISSKNSLVLLRHVPIELPLHRGSERELRILIVSSSPQDQRTLLLEPVIRSIDLLANQYKEKIKVHVLPDPFTDKFVNEINEFKPHILHFIGHGRWDRSDQAAGIAFVSQEDKAKTEWVEDAEFAGYFEDYQPDLIFLHACEGATTETIEEFKGLALQLVYSRIPVVVAMQYPIENIIACQFASKFYECLSNGKPIDRAVQEGRALLKIYQRKNTIRCRAFGIPVVYSRYEGEGSGLIVTEIDRQQTNNFQPKVGTGYCPNPQCNLLLNLKYTRCTKCGTRINKCTNCNKLIPKEARYCGYCEYPNEQYVVQKTPSEDVKNVIRSRDLSKEL